MIPEFHVFEGTTNHLIKALNEQWSHKASSQDKLYDWLEEVLYIKPNNEYRDNALDGPSCKEVLDNLDQLQRAIPACLNSYITALSAFNDVRKACFTNQLIDTYKKDIKYFHDVCLTLRDSKMEPINITNKMHILFEHVELFCTLTGKGLGFYR